MRIARLALQTSVVDQHRVFAEPVTFLEYGNFECIHCGRAYPVIKQVRKLLGDNLRFVFRHFPTVQTHPHSLRAAEAAEAAAAQQHFCQMHDELQVVVRWWRDVLIYFELPRAVTLR